MFIMFLCELIIVTMIVPTCQTDDDVTWRKKMTTAINEYVVSCPKKEGKKKMLWKIAKEETY